jgi:hypothetical protein
MVASNVKNVNRQWPLTSVTRITFKGLANGEAVALTGLPGNAVVVGGELIVQTAWDSETSAELDIGDAATDDRYGDGIDLKTLGRTALTLDGYQMVTPGDILGTLAEVGDAATEGEALLIVQYVVEGRGGEVQY